jgi:hypothetical protein
LGVVDRLVREPYRVLSRCGVLEPVEKTRNLEDTTDQGLCPELEHEAMTGLLQRPVGEEELVEDRRVKEDCFGHVDDHALARPDHRAKLLPNLLGAGKVMLAKQAHDRNIATVLLALHTREARFLYGFVSHPAS